MVVGLILIIIPFVVAFLRKKQNPRFVLARHSLLAAFIWFFLWVLFLLSKNNTAFENVRESIIDSSWGAALATLVAFIVFIIFNIRKVNFGLNVASDIVNHFSPEEKMEKARQKLNRELEIARESKYDRIFVIAHSQGSIIAIDTLRKLKPIIDSELILITAGSPFEHIYQNYFGNSEEFNDSELKTKLNVQEWYNLYRPDDFIGKDINSVKGVKNHKILGQRRGHANYWEDEVFVDYFLKEFEFI